MRRFPRREEQAATPEVSAVAAEETEKKLGSSLSTGSLRDEAMAAPDLQLLVDLMGPDAALDNADIAELMRASAPTDSLADDSFLRLDQSKLPLEMFDDEGFEKFAPEQWVSLCSSGLSPEYNKGLWQWSPVVVHGYEAASDRYLVEFRSSGRRKRVKRINLMFDGEDKVRFSIPSPPRRCCVSPSTCV